MKATIAQCPGGLGDLQMSIYRNYKIVQTCEDQPVPAFPSQGPVVYFNQIFGVSYWEETLQGQVCLAVSPPAPPWN